MWRLFLCFFVLSLPGGPVAAAECAALLRGDASLGRADATCRSTLLLGGGEQMVCHWSHLYRSAEAEAGYALLQAVVERCLASQPHADEAAPVNHPDSFRQAQYEGRGWRASVSLKDKAALGRSLVFVSLSRLTP